MYLEAVNSKSHTFFIFVSNNKTAYFPLYYAQTAPYSAVCYLAKPCKLHFFFEKLSFFGFLSPAKYHMRSHFLKSMMWSFSR